MANKRFDQLTQKTTLHDNDYIVIADSEDLDGNSYPKSKHVLGSAIRKSIFFLSDYANESTPLATINTMITSSSLDIAYLYIDDDSSENVTFSSKIIIVPAGGILSGTVVIDRVDQSSRVQIFNGLTDVTLTNNDYVLPEWFGAKPDSGVTNNTTSLDSITALMSVDKIPVKLYFGAGRYTFTTEPNQIQVEEFKLIGEGRQLTELGFHTNSDITFLDISSAGPGSLRQQVELRDFQIVLGGSGDKICIKLTEFSKCMVERISINIGGSTGDDIGLHLNKRECSTFKDLHIYCNRPIYVGDSLDHFNFHNLFLVTYSTTYPCIEFGENGAMSNCSFTGRQSWNGGNGGLYYNNTKNILNTSFHNVRWEDSDLEIPNAAANACFHLETTGYLRNVNFYNCYIAAVDTDDNSPSKCVLLRNASGVNFYGCTMASPNTNCYWLDADNSCNDIYSKSVIYQNVGQSILGSDLVFVSGVSPNEVYPYSGQQELHLMNHSASTFREQSYSYVSGGRVAHYNVEIANGATLNLIGHTLRTYSPDSFNPTMTQYIVSFDKGTGTAGGGHFLVSSNTANSTAEKVSGSSNMVGNNTPGVGEMGIYKFSGAYYVQIKNNTGETRRVQVMAIMS